LTQNDNKENDNVKHRVSLFTPNDKRFTESQLGSILTKRCPLQDITIILKKKKKLDDGEEVKSVKKSKKIMIEGELANFR